VKSGVNEMGARRMRNLDLAISAANALDRIPFFGAAMGHRRLARRAQRFRGACRDQGRRRYDQHL